MRSLQCKLQKETKVNVQCVHGVYLRVEVDAASECMVDV